MLRPSCQEGAAQAQQAACELTCSLPCSLEAQPQDKRLGKGGKKRTKKRRNKRKKKKRKRRHILSHSSFFPLQIKFFFFFYFLFAPEVSGICLSLCACISLFSLFLFAHSLSVVLLVSCCPSGTVCAAGQVADGTARGPDPGYPAMVPI